MKRQKLVAGNWKMNLSLRDAIALAQAILPESVGSKVKIAFHIPFPYIHPIGGLIKESHISVGAQNLAAYREGAYTGEVSATMLKEVGATHVLVGHSERRTLFGETNEIINDKLLRAFEVGLHPVLCIGESLADREAGIQKAVVGNQLAACANILSQQAVGAFTLAYEPVWAIGTGKTASPEQAAEMHDYIRQWLGKQISTMHQEQTLILYGGSCTPDNAPSLFNQPNIDGGLIGGASLKADAFLKIITAAEQAN